MFLYPSRIVIFFVNIELMKLLLTSSGLTNRSISNALFELVGKKPEDTSLVFIPTASNVEKGDKGWLIDDLTNLKKQNFKSIDIADISVIDKKLWLPKIEEADILFFEGGNPYYLMEWINRSGLAEMMLDLLKDKVYVGLSAGSMILGKEIGLGLSQVLYEEDLDRPEELSGLGYFDFYFLPHLNSPHFSKMTEDNIKEETKDVIKKIYAMDDNSALKIVDDKREIISEGRWIEIN